MDIDNGSINAAQLWPKVKANEESCRCSGWSFMTQESAILSGGMIAMRPVLNEDCKVTTPGFCRHRGAWSICFYRRLDDWVRRAAAGGCEHHQERHQTLSVLPLSVYDLKAQAFDTGRTL